MTDSRPRLHVRRRRPGAHALPVRLSGPQRVRLLTVAVAAVAALLLGLLVSPMEALPAPFGVPWWVLAGMFVLAEVYVLEVEVWNDSQTLSLNEVALVLGLFLATPSDLVLGQLLGTLVALGALSRLPVAKLAFNVSMYTLCTVTAVLVFRALLALGDPHGVAGWAAAFGATITAELIALVSLIAVMSLSEGRLRLSALREMLSFGSVLTLANTALALFLVVILRLDAKAAWLVLLPVVAVFVAYRSYTRERLRRERLRGLHDAMHDLARSRELDAAVVQLAGEARKVFRADRAELTLYEDDGIGGGMRTTLGPGDGPAGTGRVEAGPADQVLRQALEGRPSLVLEAPRRGVGRHPFLAERGLKDAMAILLQDGSRALGTLVVADRTGESATFSPDELIFLEAFASHVVVTLQNAQLEASLAKQRELREQVVHKAAHDALTGLPNRSRLLERLGHALAHRSGGAPAPAVVYLALDGFKAVNDTLGHAAGDIVLIEAGRRLAQAAPEGSTTARLGGDGFAVLLSAGGLDATPNEHVDALLATLRDPFPVDGELVGLSASAGVCVARDEETAMDVLRNVDVAMYLAKDRARGGFEVFEPGMRTAVVERHRLRADLQEAIAQGQFVPFYQPLVDLETGRLLGHETLIRWNHPTRGLVPPFQFIGLAEESGLIVPMGRDLLRAACFQTRQWQRRFPEHRDVYVTVNLSGRQVEDDGLIDDVRGVLRDSGLAPAGLVLEITETVAMHDTDATVRRLGDLHELGVRLAIDDFGTGYSSLAYLQRFPLDILKIAKEFVDGVVDGENDRAFVDTMVKLCGVLGLTVVAEGIESADQAESLRAMGCDVGQGYLFSRPCPARQVEELLAEPRAFGRAA